MNRSLLNKVSEINRLSQVLRDMRSFVKSYKNKGSVWDNSDLFFKVKKVERELEQLRGMIEKIAREEKRQKGKPDADV